LLQALFSQKDSLAKGPFPQITLQLTRTRRWWRRASIVLAATVRNSSQKCSAKGNLDGINDVMKGVPFRRERTFWSQIYVLGWVGAAATIEVAIAMATVIQ
jgi:hypothetical protein